MMMIQDLAHSAYQSAQDRDDEALDVAVTELLDRGPYDIDTAMQAWMDRTIVMIGHLNGKVRLKVAMISDHSDTGIPDPIEQVSRPDVAWTGQMFRAHTAGDKSAWARLWAAVPPDQTRLYVVRVLTTMALTGLAYEEDGPDAGDDTEGDPELGCRNAIHRWIAGNRKTVGLRIAKAHLN